MHAVGELHEHALTIRRFPALAVDPYFGVGWLDTDCDGAKSIAAARLDLHTVIRIPIARVG